MRIAEDSKYVLDECHELCKVSNTHMNYAQAPEIPMILALVGKLDKGRYGG